MEYYLFTRQGTVSFFCFCFIVVCVCVYIHMYFGLPQHPPPTKLHHRAKRLFWEPPPPPRETHRDFRDPRRTGEEHYDHPVRVAPQTNMDAGAHGSQPLPPKFLTERGQPLRLNLSRDVSACPAVCLCPSLFCRQRKSRWSAGDWLHYRWKYLHADQKKKKKNTNWNVVFTLHLSS